MLSLLLCARVCVVYVTIQEPYKCGLIMYRDLYMYVSAYIHMVCFLTPLVPFLMAAHFVVCNYRVNYALTT